MNRKTIVLILLGVILCGVAGAIVIRQLMTSKRYPGSPVQVKIGTALFDTSGLIWIAEHQRYFEEHGLNVEIRIFETGKFAVQALLAGEIDVATAAEFVFVGNTMNDAKLQTFGNIAKQEFHYLIGRKDKGIEKVSDLKGKKIGLPWQTSAEFYLGRYLQLHGINLDEVTIIDLKPTQVEESVVKGDVDAVLIWDPYAYSVENSLGRKAVIWPAQSGQMMYWLLIAKHEYITGHPEVIDRLLSSFDQAEQFAVNNSAKARKILQERLHRGEAYIERIWPNTRLALSLDQGLIIAMEDESRWMIDSNLTSNRKMPYYPDHIYWKGLKKVKPASLTIIR